MKSAKKMRECERGKTNKRGHENQVKEVKDGKRRVKREPEEVKHVDYA